VNSLEIDTNKGHIEKKPTYLVGIMIPIFSMALANSSGSTVPLLFRSKYLNDFMRTVSSLVVPLAFWANLFFNSLSKL